MASSDSQQVLRGSLLKPIFSDTTPTLMGVVTPQKLANVVKQDFSFPESQLLNISQHTFLEVKANKV